MREDTDNDMRVQQMMEAALELLDAGDYPADVGAHLDLAICRLREHLGHDTPVPEISDDFSTGRMAI